MGNSPALLDLVRKAGRSGSDWSSPQDEQRTGAQSEMRALGSADSGQEAAPSSQSPSGVAGWGGLRSGAAVSFSPAIKTERKRGPCQALGTTTQSHLIKRSFW